MYVLKENEYSHEVSDEKTKMAANGASDKVDMVFVKMDKLNSVLRRLDNPKKSQRKAVQDVKVSDVKSHARQVVQVRGT